LEAVTACYLIARFAGGKEVFDRTWDILRFALCGGILSSAIAATFGVTSLALGGYAPWQQYGIIWRTWWLGDAAGALVLAPCLVCAIAVVGTVHGYGPFARQSPNDSLLLLQSFLSIQALMTLVFAAEVSERRRQEEQARMLAVRDPLTGLANYRLLVERVDEEIKRYGRTGNSFAVLLLDMDGLKKINDEYGHLVGSLAICRVAEVLHLSCRETDTAARYGGDEF